MTENSPLSVEHCYQLHTPRESWNHRNTAEHRLFRCPISTLSGAGGQHTEVPWDPTHAHIFSSFLVSIFEIGKWTLRLQVAIVAYACLRSFRCAPSHILAHCGLYLTNEVILHCFRVRHMPVPPQTCMCYNWNVTPRHAKSKNPLNDFKYWC